MVKRSKVALYALVLAACGGTQTATFAQSTAFLATEIATFDEPWAMAFLPDGRLLVTEKRGALVLYTLGGDRHEVRGVPEVRYGGQGGLGDVVLHPQFVDNGLVYLSYAEAGERSRPRADVADADRRRLRIGASQGEDGGRGDRCRSGAEKATP